jgi:Transglycosylase SLT domain
VSQFVIENQEAHAKSTGSVLKRKNSVFSWPLACSRENLMKSVRFFPNSKLLTLLVAAAMTMATAACGKGFKALTAEETAELTGAKNKNGVPYTGAGDSAELKALKAHIDSKKPANIELASRIEKVKVDRLDKDGKAVTSKPSQLDVQIVVRDLSSAPLAFRVSFIGNSLSSASVPTKDAMEGTSLSTRCLDDNCLSIEFRLKTSSAESGFIHRKRTVQVQSLGPFDTQSTAIRLEKLGQAVQSASEPTFITNEIAWGAAIFELKAGAVSAFGGLTQTGNEEEIVSVSLEGEKSFDARLLGNNNRGGLLIRVLDQTAWSFIRIILPRDSSTDDGSTPVADPGPSANALIKWDPNHPVTRAFQKDIGRPEIQQMIVSSKAREAGDLGRMGRWLDMFVSRVRPTAPLITDILAKENVPAEMIFITMIESSYFRRDGFPVRKSPKGASGPWQFMPGTAKDYGLKIGEPCDERGDIVLATEAAAKMFSKLFRLYPADPKLALMAYNWGQGNVNRAMVCSDHNDPTKCTYDKSVEISDYRQKLRFAQTAGLDFWTIRELNYAPKETINYVMSFIVAQYLGRDPVPNGFAYEAKDFPAAPRLCERK